MSSTTKTSAPRPRIGMLGAGFMARTHTRSALAAGAELAALASSGRGSAERAASALGYARALDPDELIAESLPFVHVCTPNRSHVDYARAAIRAGSHVICEKPLATNAADAAALAAEAQEAGRPGAVPFVYRYHPMVREARSRIASGESGAVLTVSGQYLQDWLLDPDDDNWRVGADAGGPSRAFADIGSHLVDLVEFVSGDRIARLVATTRTVHGERAGREVSTEDSVALAVELAGGGIGTLLVSQVAPGRKNGLVLEIAGARESVRFEQEDPERLWIGRRGHSLLLRRDPENLSADAARISSLPSGHSLGYLDAFDAFMADAYAVAMGEPREGVPTFADGARAAAITDAVLDSAASGSWVEVSAA